MIGIAEDVHQSHVPNRTVYEMDSLNRTLGTVLVYRCKVVQFG